MVCIYKVVVVLCREKDEKASHTANSSKVSSSSVDKESQASSTVSKSKASQIQTAQPNYQQEKSSSTNNQSGETPEVQAEGERPISQAHLELDEIPQELLKVHHQNMVVKVGLVRWI